MNHSIDFYYDPISPYAYLAFTQLPQALQGLSVHVRYRSVLFAAMLKVGGQKGPAEIAGKREWTYRQVSWLAQQLGVRLDLPEAHPFNPLAVLRLGLSTADEHGCTNRWVTQQLFEHVWHGGADANAPERVQDLATRIQAHVQDRGGEWLGPQDEGVKALVRSNTDAAIEAGVFGVPACVWQGQVFWGLDALPMLRDAIDGGAWFAQDHWAAAANLRSGV